MTKTLAFITDEDIKGLLEFYGIRQGEVSRVIRGNENNWTCAYYVFEHRTGFLFVSNDEIKLVESGAPVQYAEYKEIQWLLDKGYKIFKDKGE